MKCEIGSTNVKNGVTASDYISFGPPPYIFALHSVRVSAYSPRPSIPSTGVFEMIFTHSLNIGGGISIP